MRKRLGIVIINYRGASLVCDCLDTLALQVDAALDAVVVVDNASGDSSPNEIEARIVECGWGGWCRLIRSARNGGFSYGNNTGMRAIDAESYLLLNSDTLLRPQALERLREAMEAHPEVGLIGPRLEWPDETPQISAFQFPTPLTEFVSAAHTGPISRMFAGHVVAPGPVPAEARHADWVSFACVLIRREVVDAIGYMDEHYFMYSEDIDYCRTALSAGWRTLYWPAARVVHLRGGSGPVKALTAARKRRPSYFYASRARYYAKFYGRAGLICANVCWLAGRAVSRVREMASGKQPQVCEREGRDIWINWSNPFAPPPESQP